MSKKYLDLFAGAGGLAMGFAECKNLKHILSVEWDKHAHESAVNFFSKKFHFSKNEFMLGDVTKISEVVENVRKKSNTVDFIIGGPPCQAYSVANRNHYKNKQDDPKNILFESYLEIASLLGANYFIFENVPGMLSAKIGDKKIIDLVRADALKKGFTIPSDKLIKESVFDMSEFGVPQKRRRIIILGVKSEILNENLRIFEQFIEKINKHKTMKITTHDALRGLGGFKHIDGKYVKMNNGFYPSNHKPRFHNERDVKIFNEAIKLSIDGKFTQKESLHLYEKFQGKSSPIHKYHVIEMNEPSTTILAHLQKDGNRFILQRVLENRSLTPREAARIQTFPDDFEFLGGQGAAFRMIGNAVPPKFSRIICRAFMEVAKWEK